MLDLHSSRYALEVDFTSDGVYRYCVDLDLEIRSTFVKRCVD